MKIRLQAIPGFIIDIDRKIAAITSQIRKDLESNQAIDASALIDQIIGSGEAEVDRELLIKLCDVAISTCQKIQEFDWSGVEGRLQRLGSDLSHLMTKKEHSLSKIIEWFEIVYDDMFGKNPS